MPWLHWRWDCGEDFLRLSGLLLLVLARWVVFPLGLDELKLHDRNVLFLHDLLRLDDLHGLNLNESTLLELHARRLCLLDAGRESTESSTARFQRLDDVIDCDVGRWKVQEDRVSDTVKLFCETIAADIAMLNCHKVSQTVIFELFPCLLYSCFVEVESVQVAGLFDGSEEVVRK